MPRAAEELTIPFSEPATGIFKEISGTRRRIDLIDAVHGRLDNIVALLYVIQSGDHLPPFVANAIGAIETAVEDAAALLSVHVPGDVA